MAEKVDFKEPEETARVNKSKIIRKLSRVSKRIRRKDHADNSDEVLIEGVASQSPRSVQKSKSLNRVRTTLVRKTRLKSNTIEKCKFSLRELDEYSAKDIPKLANHFKDCKDPAHILPRKAGEKHICLSTRPPFVKVKIEEEVSFIDKESAEKSITPEVQAIIDKLVARAEAINKKGYDDQMREMIGEAEPGFQWYLIHRVWEGVKQAPWSDVLSYFIPS